MTQLSRKPFSSHARARARRTAVQACYQWLINKQPMSEIIDEFVNERPELKKADKEYFLDLLRGVNRYSNELDEVLVPCLDREINEVSPVERAILILGTYELVHHPELPWRVIMNETVELAKMFGAEQSHKYINGVLDKAARSIRAAEISDS
jgi:N utilization substance protein B